MTVKIFCRSRQQLLQEPSTRRLCLTLISIKIFFFWKTSLALAEAAHPLTCLLLTRLVTMFLHWHLIRGQM